MMNIRIAARIVLPLPKPGARLVSVIIEPLGLHSLSEKDSKDLRNNIDLIQSLFLFYYISNKMAKWLIWWILLFTGLASSLFIALLLCF